MAINYEFKDTASNSSYSSSTNTILTKVKFNKDVIMKYLYWYRGASGTTTVSPRVYTSSGALIGNGSGIVESTNALGWYRVDLSEHVLLNKDEIYYIGFYFNGGSFIGYTSGQTVPRTNTVGGDTTITFVGGTSSTSTDSFNSTTSDSLKISFGFGIDVIANKMLILSDSEVLSFQKGGGSDTMPKMTASTTSGIAVTESSVYNTSNNGWNVFNDSNQNVATDYWATANGQTTGWLKIDYGNPSYAINNYTITSMNVAIPYSQNRMPKDWTFEGSNTGSFTGEQVILDSQTGVTDWGQAVTKEFFFSNTTRFRYYRINISSNNGDTFIGIGEMELMEYKDDKIINIPSLSEQNFINHGMDNGTEIDLQSPMSSKSYILQSSTVLGSGKVFKKSIDTLVTPIKKVEVR